MLLSIQHHNHSEQAAFTPANRLLKLLPQSDYQPLISEMKIVTIAAKTIVHYPYEPIKAVYFPIRGIISLISTTQEGINAEIAPISNEGIVGVSAFLGGQFLYNYAVAQTECIAVRLPSRVLQQQFDRGLALQKILLLYTQALLTQISQNMLCHSKHSIEQRLARLLLSYGDRLDQNELLLTQDAIADLLAVRRPSVSVAANSLQQKDIIKYSRGRIIIQNRQALGEHSCQCDQEIDQEYGRLFSYETHCNFTPV